jgi:chromate reductase
MAAAHHLRQVLLAVNVVAMPHPEAYIPIVSTLFDTSGRLQNAQTRELMTGFLLALAQWIARFPRVVSAE